MTDHTYEDLLYELHGHVAVLTFNRPGRMNAMGNTLKEEIANAMRPRTPIVKSVQS